MKRLRFYMKMLSGLYFNDVNRLRVERVGILGHYILVYYITEDNKRVLVSSGSVSDCTSSIIFLVNKCWLDEKLGRSTLIRA